MSEQPIPLLAADLSATLRPHLAKVVGTWREAVAALDSIRSLASDRDHDEIRVALKVKAADAAHQCDLRASLRVAGQGDLRQHC